MKINPLLKTAYNRASKDLLSPEALTIPVVGGYQVINNYKKALPEDKKNTFKRDSLVLLATCLGALGGFKASMAALKKSDKLTTIKKDLIKMVFIPAGGMITGFLSGEFADKYFPAKYHNAQKQLETQVSEKIAKTINGKENQRVDLDSKLFKSAFVLTLASVGVLLGHSGVKAAFKSNYFKELNLTETPKMLLTAVGSLLSGVAVGQIASISINDNEKFSVANDQLASVLNRSVSTMTGFNIGTQHGLQNKVKRGFYEIISGVLFPAAVVIPSAHLIRTKIENNKVNPKIFQALSPLSKNLKVQKKIFEKSTILSLLVGSIYVGGAIGDYFNKKIASKLVKQETWAQLDLVHQKLMMGYVSGDDDQKAKAVIGMKAVKEMKKNLK